MTPVFADTCWWLALLDPCDDLHAKALAMAPGFPDRLIVTSEMILAECLNMLGTRGPQFRRAGDQLVAQVRQGNVVISQTDRLFDMALALYGGQLDKAWSITDCASMAIMTQRGIRDVLTFDRRFEQAGFCALMRR